MTARDALIAHGIPVAGHRPWPRIVVDADGWRDAIEALAAGELTLVSEWGETGTVHMAVADEGGLAVVSLAAPDGHYPSVGAAHPPAIRLERAMADLYGITPDGLADTRPWLDHGRWGVEHPLQAGSSPSPGRGGSDRKSGEGSARGGVPPPRPIRSSPSRARACTRFRSGRSMPASSSPGTSASPPLARPSCGWRNGWDTSTRGSTG